MTSKQFIKNNIDNITSKFSNVKASYRYDEFCESHYVELLPKEMYTAIEVKRIRSKVLVEFYEKFPNESLVFLSEGSLIKMGKAEYSTTLSSATIRQLAGWINFRNVKNELPTERENTPIDFETNFAAAA